MKIAFLYTLDANKALFRPYIERYLANNTATITHHVNEQLLSKAMEAGLTHTVTKLVQQAIRDIEAEGADIIICTCSTIGDAAEQTPNINSRVIRVDRPMAEQAVSARKVHVLAALESTIEPTLTLLKQCGQQQGTSPDISYAVIPNAWPHYANGDADSYAKVIAKYVERESNRYDNIVLAQASMAPAIAYINKPPAPVLSSPELCCQYISRLI
ncbi:hypothetical protein LRP52_27220 [Photobacterium sp. ZSDE20]|uniref:Arylsulfatase n=1 Tax=Photobacterium pectinilyticum TaxID=2906793 RepID=A0ABT1N4N4_9GAMM|nr:hypothetical protein [Photobacterium sp. ZSDE20]MCQ1059705.1 hypothetical protein [Photobacterium sp. ZSDE20]MDD1825871.1 hypothetical protein [Photobacterium sp. ZSDE20]